MVKTLVIMPAYNEEKKIRKVIDECLKYAQVVVINDGSSDNTLEEARKTKAIVLDNKKNRGKGFSLRRGFNYAITHKYDYVVTIDSDGQHPPELIPKFIEEISKGYDIVIGTRKKRHSKMPYRRRATNFIFSLIFSIFSRAWIKDSQSGYRAIRVSLLKKIKLKTKRYETESELLMKSGRKDAKFGRIEIPTIYGNEKSKINPSKDFFRFVRVLKYRK